MTEEEARSLALAKVPDVDAPLTLSELESHLAAAADLLRGAIDQSDFKAFIFPLMFFKRISEVFSTDWRRSAFSLWMSAGQRLERRVAP